MVLNFSINYFLSSGFVSLNTKTSHFQIVLVFKKTYFMRKTLFPTHKDSPSKLATSIFTQFGQFVDHDLTRAPILTSGNK